MTQKFREIPQKQKKIFSITGSLALPLRVGERAFIYTSRHAMMTSNVKYILEVSENGIVFETLHTVYDLRYETIAKPTEVMCA